MNKNLNFGEAAAENLSIGDIVEWSRWNVEDNTWDMYYGIITSVKNEIKSNRLVSISTVLPLEGSSVEMEFFTLSLRLVSAAKKEELPNDIKN
tara:strand:- start:713 stop:991 length:279 start_codon:yes stop_codon:yes gene_type:complete